MKMESFWGTSTDDYSFLEACRGLIEIANFTGGALFVAENGKYVTVYAARKIEPYIPMDGFELLQLLPKNPMQEIRDIKVQVGNNRYIIEYKCPSELGVHENDIFSVIARIEKAENISRDEIFSAIQKTGRAVALAATWSVSKDIREQAIKEYKELRETK